MSRCGRTAQDTKVSGIKTKHAERVNSTMLMAMFMTVTGLTTRLTVRALITIAVEPFFVGFGVMTSSMVQGKRLTLMDLYTSEITKTGNELEKAYINGLTAVSTMVFGPIIKSTGTASIDLMMEEST